MSAASVNKTGNPLEPDTDWIMESDGIDIGPLYFDPRVRDEFQGNFGTVDVVVEGRSRLFSVAVEGRTRVSSVASGVASYVIAPLRSNKRFLDRSRSAFQAAARDHSRPHAGSSEQSQSVVGASYQAGVRVAAHFSQRRKKPHASCTHIVLSRKVSDAV